MAGELFINGIDAYMTWGVSLEDGALDALMAFAPNKQPVTNKNVTATGAYVVCGECLGDERTVSLPLHLVAKDRTDYLMKRAGFLNYITNHALVLKVALGKEGGTIYTEGRDVIGAIKYYYDSPSAAGSHPRAISVTYGVPYHTATAMYYIDCQNYKQFLSGIAKFNLSLYQPNP